MLQQALSLAGVPSASPNPRVSSSASSPATTIVPPPFFFHHVSDADSEENDDLEDICRTEFGFKLGKLRSRLRIQTEDQQAALHRFCTDVRNTPDPERRRELAKSFIMELASITERASNRYTSTLMRMQTAFLVSLQVDNDVLSGDVSRLKNEAAELKSTLQRLETEKQRIEDEARRRCEEERVLWEFSLRTELQACQICVSRPRDTVIMPCLHGQFCGECIEAHQKSNRACPICRGVIRGTLSYIA